MQYKDSIQTRTLVPIKNGSQFTAEECGGTILIRLKLRSLDSRFSERDRQQVRELLQNYRQVVVNFEEVGSPSGAGLETVAEWVNLVRSTGSTLVLAHCSAPIRSLLNLLRISRIIPVAASVRDAVAYFDSKQPLQISAVSSPVHPIRSAAT